MDRRGWAPGPSAALLRAAFDLLDLALFGLRPRRRFVFGHASRQLAPFPVELAASAPLPDDDLVKHKALWDQREIERLSAMEAGVSDHVWSLEQIVKLAD
jgi:hypothetical protein